MPRHNRSRKSSNIPATPRAPENKIVVRLDSSRSSRRRSRKAVRRDQLRECIEAILFDRWTPGLHYPCPGYSLGYDRYTSSTRFSLVSGVSGQLAVVVNPYLLWTNEFWYERVNNAAGQQSYVPTMYQMGATETAILPGKVSLSSLSMPQQRNSNPGGSTYSGYVRPIGLRFRITYLGTELNEGGNLGCIHNPDHSSLAQQISGSSPGGIAVYPSIETSSTLASMTDRVSINRIGKSFTFCWRPQSLAFKQVTSFLNADNASASVGYYAASDLVDERYLPTGEDSTKSMDVGWVTGFSIQPAFTTGFTGGPSQYVCEVDYEADLLIHTQESATSTGQSMVLPTYPSRSNAQQSDAVHSALGMLHHARSTHKTSLTAENLAMKGAKSLASGFLEGVGSRIMSAIPGA